jgi:4-amino-4-deoxy-L-arabinose transferase-like glycosyltransferase
MVDPRSSRPPPRLAGTGVALSRALESAAGGAVVLFALAMFLSLVGTTAVSLTDPDEVFYAGTAHEMLASHRLLTPILFHQPQFEKPPLFYWLLMAAFRLFGPATLVARIVPAVAGAAGVATLFLLLRRVLPPRVALDFGLLLATSALHLGLSRAVLTDSLFASLTSIAAVLLFVWYREGGDRWLHAFAGLAALATVTKGPLGLGLPLLAAVCFLLLERRRDRLRALLAGGWWWTFLALASPWYVFMTARFGRPFVDEFFVHDHWHRWLRAEHPELDHVYFYPAVFLLGLLPWTPLLAILGRNRARFATEWRFALAWLVPGVVLLTGAHSKLPSYPAPLFAALPLALALALDGLEGDRVRSLAAAVGCGLFGLGAAVALPALRALPEEFRAWLATGVLGLAAALLAGAALFALRRPRAALLAAIALQVAVLGALGATVPAGLDDRLSIRTLAVAAAERAAADQPILADRLFARGVHYFTEHDVLVVAKTRQPFWSAHPLAVLVGDDEVEAYVAARAEVVGVVGRPRYERLLATFSDRLEIEVLAETDSRVAFVTRPVP